MNEIGKASPHTNLSPTDVLNIREAGKRGEDAREVADLYGVAPSTIRKIWRGETFRHVGTAGAGPMGKRAAPAGLEPTREEIQASQAKLMEMLQEQAEPEKALAEMGEDRWAEGLTERQVKLVKTQVGFGVKLETALKSAREGGSA